MRTILAILGAAAVAAAVPVVSHAQIAARTAQSWEQKACADTWKPEPGSSAMWEWQANHNLDCAVAFIDEQIGVPGASHGVVSEDDTVTLRRADLEKLRQMLMTAKDGAQRLRH